MGCFFSSRWLAQVLGSDPQPQREGMARLKAATHVPVAPEWVSVGFWKVLRQLRLWAVLAPSGHLDPFGLCW